MRTFLSYPGGKARIGAKIAEQLAPHRVYVEPFSGTASVLFAKPRTAFELINDVDGRITTLLRVVRDEPTALATALSLTPYARGEYEDADPDAEGLDDVEIARRVCVRIGQSFAKVGMADWTKGWRVSIRGGRACGLTWADLPERVLEACERLQGVHIDNIDAVDLIERYGTEDDAAIYVDPPYLGTTRSKSIYAREMPDEDQHRRLAAALADCRAHVLLSGYESPLYAEMYSDWDRMEIKATANHNGNSGAETRRVEVLWSNRPMSRQQSFEETEVAA